MIVAHGRPEDAMAIVSAPPPDDKLQALEDSCATLGDRLASGLTVARDNPGRTPQQWSVRDASGRAILFSA